MYYQPRCLLLGWLGTVFLGGILCVAYQHLPCGPVALFAPVCHSLWEQLKLIYWPYLLAALLLKRGRPDGMRPWLLALAAMCALHLSLGWLYHMLLGGEAAWVDRVLYLSTMAFGFWLPTRFSGPFSGLRWTLPVVLVVVLGLLIALFTLWPPQSLLFADLSFAGAWLPLPC